MAPARHADIPTDLAFLLGQIEFAQRKFKPQGFVVVGHDCGYYERFCPREVGLEEKMKDITAAAAFLKGRFGLPTSAHFKKITGSGFEQLA